MTLLKGFVALNVLMLLLGVAACSTVPEGTSGDCNAIIRVKDRTYTAVTMTKDQPVEKLASAATGRCEDIGEGPAGVVFDDEVDKVQVWMFEGYGADVVLGVRIADSWQVFVEDSVAEADRESIASDFS
jgi:hypothetical protein